MGTGDLSLLRYKPDFVINLFVINELYCIVFTDERQQRHNPIIIRPHIVFIDGRQNDNPIITRPHIVFTDGRQQRQPNHNMTTYYVY